MGVTPQERVMLVLRALWARDRTPVVPEGVKRKAEEWMEGAQSPILRQLWVATQGR
jgi:hypothetical protein